MWIMNCFGLSEDYYCYCCYWPLQQRQAAPFSKHCIAQHLAGVAFDFLQLCHCPSFKEATPSPCFCRHTCL
jgi:hypothetical protein